MSREEWCWVLHVDHHQRRHSQPAVGGGTKVARKGERERERETEREGRREGGMKGRYITAAICLYLNRCIYGDYSGHLCHIVYYTLTDTCIFF